MPKHEPGPIDCELREVFSAFSDENIIRMGPAALRGLHARPSPRFGEQTTSSALRIGCKRCPGSQHATPCY